MAVVLSLTVDVPDEKAFPGTGKGLLSGAVIASLGIHTAIFAGLLSISWLPESVEVSESPQNRSIAITLVNRSADTEITPDTPANILQPEPGEHPEDPAALMPSQGITSTDGIGLTPVVTNRVRALNRQDKTENNASEQALVNAPRDRAEVLALVNSLIASFKVENRQVLNQEFVASCLRYRNRYGRNRDCPESFNLESEADQQEKALAGELFANVTRDADHARMSRKLERENSLLEGIMKEGGAASEQAEIRWRLNRQYHAFLNGNIHPELTRASQTAMVNDYGRTITPGPFQFRCKDRPCVYKYTGFEIRRPANYVEKAPSFVVQPPLFKGSEH